MTVLQSPSFTVVVIPDRERVALVPIGELDMLTAGEVEREARDLRDAGFTRIVVDLRRTEFLDVFGLRVLLALHEDASVNGHALTVVEGPPAVQRLFELTGTQAVFEWETEVSYRPWTGPTSRLRDQPANVALRSVSSREQGAYRGPARGRPVA